MLGRRIPYCHQVGIKAQISPAAVPVLRAMSAGTAHAAGSAVNLPGGVCGGLQKTRRRHTAAWPPESRTAFHRMPHSTFPTRAKDGKDSRITSAGSTVQTGQRGSPPRHCNSKGSGGRPAFACMTRPASGRARPSPGHVAAHLRYGMRSGSIEGLAAPRSGAFGIRLAVQRYAHDKKNSRGYPCPSMPIRVSVERIFDIFRTFHVIVSRSFST